MKPQNRQEAIAELIRTRDIEDQKSLVELLESEYQIVTNQATVSRDLHRLGAVKKSTPNGLAYELPNSDPTRELLRLAIVNVEHNESLIVVHTLGALAGYVGDYFDANAGQDVMATLGGENTLLVVPRSTKDIKRIYKQVCELVHFKGAKS